MSHTIQSDDYVPGISGWKIDTGTGAFELASDRVTVSGGDSKALYCGKSIKESQKKFIVVDGVTYIRQSSIETSIGQLQSQFVVNADRFAINGRDASEALRDIIAILGETSLGKELKLKVAQIDGSVSAAVKEVIRIELQPGGLLHRSR